MNIPFAKLLSLPLVALIVVFFLTGDLHSDLSVFGLLIVPTILLSVLYVFQYQVNQWWWRHRPPVLSPQVLFLIKQLRPQFEKWTRDDQALFLDRLAVFMYTKNFVLKREKDYEVEEDSKALMALEFVRLTLRCEEYLFEHYDQFVLYDHPFGTPAKPELHSIETFHEDGVVIMSREQLFNSLLVNDQTTFNLGLWVAVTCFIQIRTELKFPVVDDLSLEQLWGLLRIDQEEYFLLAHETAPTALQAVIYAFVQHQHLLEHIDKARVKQLTTIFGRIPTF